MISLAEFSEVSERGREARVTALMAHAVRGHRYRCMRISVDDMRVRLTVPASVSDERLRIFLLERDDWIVRHVENRTKHPPLTELADGGRFLLRGRMMRIETTIPRLNLKMFDHEVDDERGVVCFAVSESLEGGERDRIVAGLVRELLFAEFEKLLRERGELMIRQTGLSPARFAASNALGQWGSCNTRGVIRLSWRLACLDSRLFDYVLVHELMHLREMNHSPDFWRLVELHCPQYRELRKELKAFQIASLA